MIVPDERPGAGAAGPHAWENSRRGWDGLLVVSVLVPAAFVLTEDAPAPHRLLVAGLLLAIIPAWAWVGRPAVARDAYRWGIAYIALLVALFTPAVLLDPACTFALFGLCPQAFITLHRGNQAIGGVLALALPCALRFAFVDRSVGGAFNLVTIATTTVFFCVVFGGWLDRITTQSRERAELITELEASRAEVARLSAERGALAERERLAGEIHDTLAQGFTSIIMLIQAAEARPDPARHLELAARTARENLAEARALIEALRPAPLDGSPLDEALRRITGRIGDELGVPATFTVTGAARPLRPRTEVVVVRSAQEALANVRKHATPASVAVGIDYGDGEVTLHVRDDGTGFPADRPPGGAGGYGLTAMRQRAAQAGGEVTVDSAPGRGTLVTVRLPAEETA
ncbi:two-component sensor histidine kinase [Sphaerisporangium rufum]|uniref:Oxygen sensor histidine kinase NreB n=2 Tax=Sphaerisporangium rufum TaxID=1381558 RepID=A0A919R1V2_9ACTN|nr:two-component sensor histidine kinase [Sphaerisporangium rufum]